MFLRVRSLNTQNYNVKRCPAGVDRATRTSTPLDTTSLEPLQINLFGDFVEYSGVRALCSKYFGNTQIHVFKVATDLKKQDLARNPRCHRYLALSIGLGLRKKKF
jgi:hypothetical protein